MISTHILDTSLGHPAEGVTVQLDKKTGANSWDTIATEKTNTDGRIAFSCSAEPGTYRLQFYVEDYFRQHQRTPFFTLVPVYFEITDVKRKYHVPLLLNPYGYSTYRGS